MEMPPEFCRGCAQSNSAALPREKRRLCLQHLGDAELETVLAASKDAGYLEARAVAFNRRLLDRVLSAIASAGCEDARRCSADFSEARFEQFAVFVNTHFGEGTKFHQTDFTAGVSFKNAAFEGPVSFQQARFTGDAEFRLMTVDGDSTFTGATFALPDNPMAFQGSGADFSEVQFRGRAEFSHASFEQSARFDGAVFEGHADFSNCTAAAITFSLARVCDRISFADASIKRVVLDDTFVQSMSLSATFGSLHLDGDFATAGRIGEIRGDLVVVSHATFRTRPRLEVASRRLGVFASEFAVGADLYVRGGDVVMNHAQFNVPSVLTRGNVEHPRTGPSPRLISLAQTNATNLSLVDVNLQACHFAGTHNLDQLRIEGTSVFAPGPNGWRWTRRQTIAEEHYWRMRHGRGAARKAWDIEECRIPQWVLDSPPMVVKPSPLKPNDVAELYRTLRKALEDRKNEPGAADFYYGEMEMRRLAAPLLTAERLVLTLYWATSGYALRASRALLALAIVIIAAAVLLTAIGFHPHQSFGESVLFSIGTSARIAAGPPADKLAPAGQVIHVGVGVIGPALLGLALFSLRGRVKR